MYQHNYRGPRTFRIYWLGILLLLAFFVIGLTAPVDADSRHSVTVAPGTNDIELSAGESITERLTVINNGQDELLLEVKPGLYTINGESYDPSYEPVNGISNSPADWLTIKDGSQALLAGGDDQAVTYSVDVPAGTAPGGYVTSILIETEMPDAGPGVKATHRIAHLVYINVAGDVRRDGLVESDSLPWFIGNGQQTITYRAKNSGGTNEVARFGLRVQDMFGRELLANDASRYVLPGTTRAVELQWQPAGVLGLFKVTRSCEIANNPCDVGSTWQLYVHPLGAVLAIALVGLYTGYMIWWQSRKKKRRL